MATIFILNQVDLKLKFFEIIKDTTFETSVFSIKNQDSWCEQEIQDIKTKCKGSDVYHTMSPFSSQPHWHEGEEHRLFITGKGTFFIPNDNDLYCVECQTGDLIWLEPKLVHWFQTPGRMTAARFFAKDLEHTNHISDIPHSIFRLRDQFYNGFNITI